MFERKSAMKKRVFFNEDMTHYLFSVMNSGSDGTKVTPEVAAQYVRQYKSTAITDFFINTCGILSVMPSEVKTSYMDRAEVTEERGEKVNYADSFAGVAKNIYENCGDFFNIWIDELRKININPWVSIRMNDCHNLFEKVNILVPPEYYENFDKNSRIRHRKQSWYYDRCLDFELENVRSYTKAYIDETLSKYDVYGIELDFQRELECFGIGREEAGREIMTEFVGELRALVKEHEKRRGHEIKVALRGHQRPEYSYEMGFDIGEMAKRGYIDMYIAAPRWAATDMDLPLTLWKQLLEPYGVEVVGGIDINVACKNDVYPVHISTPETSCALAVSVLSQGAGLYLFNYFDNNITINDRDADGDDVLAGKNLMHFLDIAGDIDALLSENRKCLVTPVDKGPVWRIHNAQLPLSVNETAPGFIKITTGEITDGKVYLNLGISGASDKLEVYVNSTPAKFVKTKKCGLPYLTDNTVYEFEIEHEALSEHSQVAEIFTDKEIIVDYADIEICVK